MRLSSVIVTFNPGEKIKETIEKLNKQVEKIFIIDNNSILKKELLEIENYSNIEIIYNDKNVGLAKAQNQGIKRSIEEKFDWILFLDDDSELEENFIPKMKEAYSSYTDKNELGIIVPNVLFRDLEGRKIAYPVKKNFFIKRVLFDKQKYIDKIMFAISSGSLIKVDMIKQIGIFREDFFIDHIDVEYCLRVNMKGYNIRAVKEAKLYQKVGNTSYKKIGGFKFYPTNHNPKRQYTKFRNALWTWKEYVFIQPNYIIYDVLLMINHMLRVLIFEENKKENLKNILKGIKHGLFRN